jgi:GT2 family glycosyltransferase
MSLAPLYDHNWPHQRHLYYGPARSYRGYAREWLVPFVDGKCMLITRRIMERVGSLDDRRWPLYGWGCDKDYAMRVRRVGGCVWVTARCYLNHFARQTSAGFDGYSEAEAERENNDGMSVKWGPSWQELLYEGFPNISRVGLVQERLLGR